MNFSYKRCRSISRRNIEEPFNYLKRAIKRKKRRKTESGIKGKDEWQRGCEKNL